MPLGYRWREPRATLLTRRQHSRGTFTPGEESFVVRSDADPLAPYGQLCSRATEGEAIAAQGLRRH